MSAIIFDTETTGINEPEVIEAAWLRLGDYASLYVTEAHTERFRPTKPIELGAMATHHIMDEDVEGCAPSASFRLPAGVSYLIGHNVDYDWKAIGEPNVRRICALALCRKLWPGADSYSQSAMIYLLERRQAREILRNAHSALADVQSCHLILRQIVSEVGGVESWEGLWALSERARIPTVMPFGKHKGERIEDVPADYKAWLLRQSDVDPYLMKALRGEAALVRENPDDYGTIIEELGDEPLPVGTLLYTTPPTSATVEAETIERCAQWHDERQKIYEAQRDAVATCYVSREALATLASYHAGSAKGIRALASQPADKEG